MHVLKTSREARRRLIMTAAALAGFGFSTARAGTLYWDENQTYSAGSGSGGGSGDWDTTSLYWYNGAPPDQTWSDYSDAVFGGTAGTITLTANLSPNTLTFNTTGYVINDNGGGNGLGLVGGGPTTFVTGGTTTETFSGSAGTANVTVGAGLTATINAAFISQGTGVLTLGGGGKLILGAQSTYAGNTSILAGTLQIGATNALPTGTNVILGAVGDNPASLSVSPTLSINGFNQTINGLDAISSGAVGGPAATDTIIISAGNTLNITGGVSGSPITIHLGAGTTVSSAGSSVYTQYPNLATNVDFVGTAGYGNGGGGNLTINAGYSGGIPSYNPNFGVILQIGERGDAPTVDMRDLASFTASLGSFEVGDSQTAATAVDQATLYLAPITNFEVSALGVAAASAGTVNAPYVNTLFLGNTSTQINALDISVGAQVAVRNANLTFSPPASATNARASGVMQFNPGTTGSITIRDEGAGISGDTALFMIYAAPASSNDLTSTVDLTGHHADILLNQIVMAYRTNGSTTSNTNNAGSLDGMTGNSNATATLTFDPPALDTGSQLTVVNGGQSPIPGYSTILGYRGNYNGSTGTSGPGNIVAVLNVGGPASTSVSLNAVAMATNVATTSRAGGSTGIINFAGGTGSIASLQMADDTKTTTESYTATAGNTITITDTSNGVLNITGGMVNMGGNITRAGGGGMENTQLTITGGGVLNMNGYNIGDANNAIGVYNAAVSPYSSLSFGSASSPGFNSLPAVTNLTGTLENLGEFNGGSAATIAGYGVLSNTTSGGTLILTGNNTYSGGTGVFSSGTTPATAATVLANSPVGSNSTGIGVVSIYQGGVLAGTGNVNGGTYSQVNVNSSGVSGTPGGIISAGTGATSSKTTGLLTTSGGDGGTSTFSEVWNGGSGVTGGAYYWKVNTASSATTSTVSQSNGVGTTDPGGPGTDWDMLSMATLDVNASGSSQFNVQVVPIGGSSLGGNQYTIADITSGIVTVGPTTYTGNSPSTLASLQTALRAALNLNTAALNPPTGYSIGVVPDGSSSGDDIVINYSSAPEPTSLAMLGLGMGAAIMTRRRRAR